MAYNRTYNPDALPAHAEPEEAAAVLTRPRPHGNSNSNPPPPPSKYMSPPPPPQTSKYNPPQSQQQGYGGRSSSMPNQAPQGRLSPQPGYGQYQQQPPPQQQQPHYSDGYSPVVGPYAPPQFNNQAPPSSHGRPMNVARPPPTPAPMRPMSGNNEVWEIFNAVDRNGNGKLTEDELRNALINGDYSAFDLQTVRMMINMFAANPPYMTYQDFAELWGFLSHWRSLFDRFDVDRSGSISFSEYSNALSQFGYTLSAAFIRLIYNMHDTGGRGAMNFDKFMQSCIVLKRCTDSFKRFDTDRDGYITLSFEEYLTEILEAKRRD